MAINEEFKPLSKPRISFHKFAFYFITLAALVLIYLRFSEVRLIRDLFLRSNIFWLFGVIVTQLIIYYFVALNYRDVLRVKDLEVGVRELFPITFVIQFLNQALPSAGFSGQAFFVQYLKKFGLTVAEGIGRAILELATLYMAFGVFFIVSAVLMFRNGIISQHSEARYFIYAFAFFAMIALSWFLALQKRKRGRLAKWAISKIHSYFENRRKNKNGINGNGNVHTGHVAMIIDQFKETFNVGELKKRARPFWLAFFWQNMILLAMVLTLYFLSFAVDYKISFSVAFITFTLTKFLSMIAFVPGGLGVFEGGMTLILISFGVPAQPALAMTLLLRAVSFWLPMPVGWILYRWYLHRYELEHPYEGLPVNGGK
ncbi:MAG: flippase-like domain-containing protein [Candidatus Yanofskybacteria bacterium]|nr:flippase-like domain-containing protein [Candidatus Yanofskybacteria bacterium]